MNQLIPAAFDDLEVGVALHDPETSEVVEVNRQLEKLSGYTESQLQELAVDEYSVSEEFTHATIERRIQAAAEGEPQTFDWHLNCSNGEKRRVSVRLARTTLDSEVYVIAEIREKTDIPQATFERQELLDRMSDGFFAVDSEWRITHANRQGREVISEAMAGEREETEILGCQLWEAIPEAVGTTLYNRYHEAMEQQKPVHFEEYYEPIDAWFDIRAYPSETGLSVYFYDVTEQHNQRELLKRRERVLREMYEIISDHNRGFDEQVEGLLALGRSELDIDYGTLSEIDGEKYIFEIVDTDDDSVQAGDVVPVSATNCERVADENRTLVLGYIPRDAPDHTDRLGYTKLGISSYIGAPLVVDDTVRGTFCFYDTNRRDGFSEWEITLVDLMSRWVSYELQREATTERLQQQNRKLEEFASTVSHDLRNPLNILGGRLELAAETGDAEEFAACNRAVDRMNTLIDELLSLARAGETIDELNHVGLSAVVEACWTTVATEEATLRVETDRTIRADETRLQQLFENLFRNSVEHGGETVTITVGDLGKGFFVADDGSGIPEADYETVFESGYSTAEDGTGFGLAIIDEIAEAHGWEIEVTTSADGGARFEFDGVMTVE